MDGIPPPPLKIAVLFPAGPDDFVLFHSLEMACDERRWKEREISLIFTSADGRKDHMDRIL